MTTTKFGIIPAMLGALVTATALAQGERSSSAAMPTGDVAAEMTAAAAELLGSVRGEPEFSEVLRDYSMEDELLLDSNDEQRYNWAYWPTERAGLELDLMHSKHRSATQELLWASLSPKGYHKVLNIMQLENVLAAVSSTGFPRGIGDYTVTLFGEPTEEAPWSWRFEGHHVSLSVSVVPGQGVSVTPTFLGADPAEIPFGPLAGVRVLRVEEDLGRALVNSLSPAQREAAVLSGDPEYNAEYGYDYAYDVPWDLYASNILKDRSEWDDWKTLLEPDGIAFADLQGPQQALLLRLLDEVFATYRPEVADRYRASLNLDELRFTWIGGLNRNEPHYYRVQTEDFLFEYDNVQGNGNHVHAVWRSRSGDFGADLLARHYAAEAH